MAEAKKYAQRSSKTRKAPLTPPDPATLPPTSILGLPSVPPEGSLAPASTLEASVPQNSTLEGASQPPTEVEAEAGTLSDSTPAPAPAPAPVSAPIFAATVLKGATQPALLGTGENADALIEFFGSKSKAIRALRVQDVAFADIARALNVRYQHVRNVLNQPQKRLLKAEREAAKEAKAAGESS